MSNRKYVFKPGEKKSDISKDSSTTITANSVVIEVADGVTTPQLVKALEVMARAAQELDAET